MFIQTHFNTLEFLLTFRRAEFCYKNIFFRRVELWLLSNIFCFAGYKSYAISKNYFASVSDMGEANHEKVSKNVRLIIRNVEFLEVAFSICFLFGILLATIEIE